jgi:hypothetical protein
MLLNKVKVEKLPPAAVFQVYNPHFEVSRRDFVDFFVGRSKQS